MSNLKVTNIQSKGTGFNDVVSFQNASGTENGTLCRAFVNFNGGTGTGDNDVTIRESFNVSSVNDDATGKYTVFFSSPLPDGNYAVTVTHGTSPGMTNVQNLTTNSFEIETFDSSAAAIDRSLVFAVIHG